MKKKNEVWVVVDERSNIPLAVFCNEDKAIDFMIDAIKKFHYNENDIYVAITDFYN